MNKRILNLILLFAFMLLTATAYSQAVTMSAATGGLAGAAQISGTNNIAILGVQLTKAAGGGNTVTSITIAMTPTPVGKFTNARLYESTDATFSGVGTEILVTTGTITATDISFTGSPLTNFDGATAAADDEYFFIVVDVDPAAATGSTTTPSLASTGVVVSASTITGTTITGAAYTLTAPETTIANLATGLATSPLLPGATGQGVFGFSLTSTGTQTITALDIQVSNTPIGRWGSYSLITSTDNDFSTPGDNVAIGGLTITPSATHITISGLSETITTTATNYFLVVNVDAAAAGSTITPSLGAANVTASTGTFTGTATGTTYSFAPILTIANLTTGLAASPLVASTTNQGVFGFSLTSNGTQTVTAINVQLTSTPASKWSNYKLMTSTDASYATGGDNTLIGGLTFTPSATEVVITGLSQNITATGTNYFLVVDVDASVTGATTAVRPSLAAGNITITTGGGVATGSAIGTNYSFGTATATFAQLTAGIAASPLSAGATDQAIIGFSASSNSTQTFTAINILVSSNPASKWGSYTLVQSTDADFSTTGDNTTISGLTITPSASQITITGLTETLNSTAKNYFLVVTINAGVTSSTGAIQPSFTQTNVTVTGSINSVTVTGTSYSFNASQLSDIIFTGGSGLGLNYRLRQATSINNTDLNGSFNLGKFQLRDGGGTTDGDNKASSITSITLQITNPANIRQIALFNEVNGQGSDNTEIAGTEQTMPGSGTVVFTPSTPIRTLTDGGNWNFMVRVTFNSTVTDNQPMVITVNSVTGETGYSGFAAADGGNANSSAGSNHTILVTASKFKFNPAVPTTSPRSVNFGPVTIVAVDGNPLNNQDLDYTGKIDLIATGGPGTLTGGGQKTLVAGQVTIANLSINQAGNYSLDVSDDDYNDAPDNQNPMEDISASITITSSASTITLSNDPVLCYGGSTAFKTLSNIVITETDASGISGSGTVTFSLALPSGFVFDQSVTSGVSVSGGSDLSAPSNYTYPGANVVQFSFNINGTSNTNTITISNLKARYPHPGINNQDIDPTTGVFNITRLGGTASIAGVGAGTVLGTISATNQTSDVTFTVTELSGNPYVAPNTTTFNAGSVPVKLVSSSPIAESVFQGSSGGVTYSSPDYRFNPSSLAAGTYPVTLIHTISATGCQSYFTQPFEVIISGIGGLAPSYCNNDGPSSDMTVNPTYIDQIMQYSSYPTTWVFDKFVYYDYTISNWKNITSPDNKKFAPALPEYQDDYAYWGGQIPIGFSVYNTNTLANVPAGSNYVVTYQWVTVNAAPSPTFTLPKTTFCLDDPAVVLTGTPPNLDNPLKDFFFATETTSPFNPSPFGTISVSIPPTSKVWSFNPGTLGVGTALIRYTYENPATGCRGTSAPIQVTVNARPASVDPAAIISPGGTAPETCQGAPIGTFTATNLTPPNQYTWYSNSGLTTIVGTGNTFAPPNPPVDPNIPTPSGSPHTFYVTQTINGCESNKQPVSPTPAQALTVTIKAAPTAPVPNFPDTPDREFCVGTTILTSNLVVPGTDIKWFIPGTSTLLFSGTTPTLASLNIPVPTTSPAVYEYEVTQTVSSCESPRTPVKVRIKGLPTLSVSAGATDPLKICTEGGHDGGSGTLITFTGSDENGPVATGTWTVPSGPTLAPGALIPGGGTALLNTPTLIPNNYTLRFTHTNSADCSNSIDIPLTVLPKIIPILDPQDSCFDNFVRLHNISTIQTGSATPVPATSADIVSTSWNFNDGNALAAGSGSIVGVVNNGRTKGTYFSPEHNFAVLGSKSITYTMNTTYCSFSGTKQLTINPKPQINFTWFNPCFDSATLQSTTRFTATEMTTPSPLAIDKYIWDFRVTKYLDTLSTTNQTTSNPLVNYGRLGTDTVQLIVVTTAQCRDTLQKAVYILPTYKAITDTSGYNQNFNTGNNFWITGGIHSSWALGNTIAGTESSDGAAWATGLMSSNNVDEQSWVMSGCFNFSDAKKPVVSLDIWSDAPSGVDGTVFQFNKDGRIENEGSWQVLGDATSGINWYDGSGISNSPGNQTSNDYGWTGTYEGWRKAIYKLDAAKPASPTAPDSLVIFRIAFAGGNRQQSGFAFDNVFVGERSRVVLLESFTNTSNNQNTINTINAHNAEFKGFGDVTTGELVKIQYHTAFPGNDLLNEQNQQMNNSRTAFYGITQAPAARVDGGYGAGVLPNWLSNYNDDRILTPSIIRLDSTGAKKSGTNVKIGVKIRNISSESISLNGTNVFVVVVQKEILRNATTEDFFGETNSTGFVYVAKQMLPSAAGTPLTGTLASGKSYIGLDSIVWSHPNGGDAIVVFLQKIDGNSKTIYQAFLLENPPIPDVITSTEDPEYAKHINLYPNPANANVNIELPAVVNKPTPVELYDAFGRVVYQSVFNVGEKTKTVSTAGFADGIYMMQLVAPQGNKVVKKVMVKH